MGKHAEFCATNSKEKDGSTSWRTNNGFPKKGEKRDVQTKIIVPHKPYLHGYGITANKSCIFKKSLGNYLLCVSKACAVLAHIVDRQVVILWCPVHKVWRFWEGLPKSRGQRRATCSIWARSFKSFSFVRGKMAAMGNGWWIKIMVLH